MRQAEAARATAAPLFSFLLRTTVVALLLSLERLERRDLLLLEVRSGTI